MSHPCDGHACDHCYLCDVVGICCATVPHAAVSAVSYACDDTFRTAVIADAARRPDLGRLLWLDSVTALVAPSIRLALPAGQALASDQLCLSTTPDKEAEHVLAPRRHQS